MHTWSRNVLPSPHPIYLMYLVHMFSLYQFLVLNTRLSSRDLLLRLIDIIYRQYIPRMRRLVIDFEDLMGTPEQATARNELPSPASAPSATAIRSSQYPPTPVSKLEQNQGQPQSSSSSVPTEDASSLTASSAASNPIHSTENHFTQSKPRTSTTSHTGTGEEGTPETPDSQPPAASSECVVM